MYGKAWVRIGGEGFAVRAPRVVWFLVNGGIPNDRFVCHSCDNPPCCNPAHLFLGTADDNNQDKIRKGRSPSKLTVSKVGEIHRRAATGEPLTTIAVAFGVSGTHVSKIVRGEKWASALPPGMKFHRRYKIRSDKGATR